MHPGIISEKKVISDLLRLYKKHECLWNPVHPLYQNKEARECAYEVLLDKYKIVQDDANIETVKKKIEYLRNGYRREHRKVLAVRANSRWRFERCTALWYYDHLTFLNDVTEFFKFKNVSVVLDSDDDSQIKLEYADPPAEKETISSVFSTEEDYRPERDLPNSQDNERPEYLYVNNESESFGKTVGLQLRELPPMQKCIAEKLISDVIFYGRFERLNSQSELNLNEDCL